MTNATPPGWYPDGTGSGAQRWWDGAQWSEYVQSPHPTVVPIPKAPEGTSPNTVQLWLIVGIFIAQLISGLVYLITIDWTGYFQAMLPVIGPDGTITAPQIGTAYASMFTPGYFVASGLSLFGYAGSVLLAYFDWKALKDRGVVKPFHWAFGFINSVVYVIGRSIVARRRTGSGIAPMWIVIITLVLYTIASFVISAVMMSNMFSLMNDYMNQISNLGTYPVG